MILKETQTNASKEKEKQEEQEMVQALTHYFQQMALAQGTHHPRWY